MQERSRVFLGWDAPVLPRAVRWLLERYADRLADVVVVVPGRRARRLLLAHLAAACAERRTSAARRGGVPPRVVTPGAVPELFYRPPAPLAGDRARVLAWCAALDAEAAAGWAGDPEVRDDFGRRLALARELVWAQDELGEEGLCLADVPARAGAALQGTGETERWQAMGAMEADVRGRLERAHRWEPTAARLWALERGDAGDDGPVEGQVVLCGLAMVPGIARAFLGRFATAVTALVAASEDAADCFDDWGAVDVERWRRRRVTLEPGRLIVTRRPRDQAAAVARLAAQALRGSWTPSGSPEPRESEPPQQARRSSAAGPRSDTRSPSEPPRPSEPYPSSAPQLPRERQAPPEPPSPDATGGANDSARGDGTPPGERAGVTICLADASLSGAVGEALADREIAFHDILGAPLASSAPWRLLGLAARYAESRSVRDLAQLLRHPDVERFLDAPLGAAVAAAPAASTREMRDALERRDWLTVLDLYISETILARVGEGRLPGDPAGAAVLAAADAALRGELGDGGASEPLVACTRRIRAFLLGVYAERALGDDSADHAVALALTRLGEELGVLEEAAGIHEDGPRVRLAEAIDLLLSGVAGESVATESDPGAVDVVGWLELPLDDAPRAVVAGLVEQTVGSAREGLLGPALRRELGLADADALYARDLYFLELVASSRDATFLTARRGAQGEPLAPRRILLAGGTPALVETVHAFWGERAAEGDPEAGEVEDRCPGSRSGFGPILPAGDTPLPGRLPAIAFRDYLACPYRFYLRHVLGLRAMSDLPRELDPSDFGRLLHTVLGRFARSEAANSVDADRIAGALDALAAEEIARRAGATPRVTVRLQLEQLRRRLRSFARWQAEQAQAGWRIVPEYVEAALEATLDVDGAPFVVAGRVDRVDRHPELGARLLDYKSAEQAATPEQAHRAGRRGERRWVDLQLPLYERMLRERGVRGELRLGFVNLGHRLAATPLALAEWTALDLESALAVAAEVVRSIRARRFWPPGDAPSYADGFEGLTGDAFPDRERYLRGA